MEDPIEQRLRELMRGEQGVSDPVEEQRLERVLHRAHIHGGIFDLINLFSRWGWVLSEGGARGLRHARPVSRRTAKTPSADAQQEE